MGRGSRARRADGRNQMGVQAEIATVVGSARDWWWVGIRRFVGRQLLCAGCRDGQDVVGLPDRRRDVLEHHVVRGGWAATDRGDVRTRAVCFWVALSDHLSEYFPGTRSPLDWIWK